MSSGGAVADVDSADTVANALSALTSKDVVVLQAAIDVLLKATTSTDGRASLVRDTGVPRLAYFVCSVANNPALRGSLSLAESGCAALWNVAGADPSCGPLIARELSSRALAALLKVHYPATGVADSIVHLLLLLTKHEKNCGLVARLDGGIQLLLQYLCLEELPRSLFLACIELMNVYCITSDNNLTLFHKRSGLECVVEALRTHQDDFVSLLSCMRLLSTCAKNPKLAQSMGDLGAVQLLVNVLGQKSTPPACVESCLGLLGNLTCVESNVKRMWETGAFATMWLVIRRIASQPSANQLLKVSVSVAYKMFASQGVTEPCDLSERLTWPLARYPGFRGMVEADSSRKLSDDPTYSASGAASPVSDGTAQSLVVGDDNSDSEPEIEEELEAPDAAPSPLGDDTVPEDDTVVDDEDAELSEDMEMDSDGTPLSEQEIGIGGGPSSSSISSMVAEKMDLAAQAASVWKDWYPERFGGNTSGEGLPDPSECPIPGGVFIAKNGTISVAEHVVSAEELPAASLMGAALPLEPMLLLDPESRQVLTQTMMLRVLARLANLQSGQSGQLVYDALHPSDATPTGGSGGESPLASGGTRKLSVRMPTVRAAAADAEGGEFDIDGMIEQVAVEMDTARMVRPLSFESRFECGNLRAAVRIAAREYDLVLASDVNTRGHTQWFYFRVTGMDCGVPYRFNIVNLEKPDSTYNMGMQPVMCCVSSETGMSKWQRAGNDICYYQNHLTHSKSRNAPIPEADASGAARPPLPPRPGSADSDAGSGGSQMYTATWGITFPPNTVAAFLAYSYPYSFTDLMLDIKTWEARSASVGNGDFVPVSKVPVTGPVHSDFLFRPSGSGSSIMRRTILCRTLSGNPVPLLTITDFSSSPELIGARPYVVLSARVHPGETNASWMMRGVLDFLTSSAPEAEAIRSMVIVKVVPFLNPDGVINGNHRTNLAGLDLNRTWTLPVKDRSPPIWHLRQLLTNCSRRKKVHLFCDFHGHSRRMNIFMFGCENPEGTPERVFPKMLDARSPFFSYKNCSFKVQKAKANCARVAIWRDLGITNSFTIEASFCGADQGVYKDQHFQPRHFEELGHDFCRSLFDYLCPDESQLASVMAELAVLHPSKFGGPTDGDKPKGKGKKAGTKKKKAAAPKPKQKQLKPREKPPVRAKSSGSASGGSTPKVKRNSGASAKK